MDPSSGSGSRAAHVVWHESTDERAWVESSTSAIAHALQAALAVPGNAHLLLSGGTTPAPVYRALAAQDLDW
ncbi:MAG: 6-phosphogluconolactonase, partial [Dokdonella sp.]